ncbi:hypothetical protein RBB50_003167 [Rhinocladiella similis]
MTSNSTPAPKLQHVATLRGYVSSEISILSSKSTGQVRSFAPITSGFFKLATGEFEAELVAPAWPVTTSSADNAYLDVRCRAKSDAGHVYIQYSGFLAVDEATTKALRRAPDAESTQVGDTSWFTGVIIETSDEKLKWLETSVLVGQGRVQVVDDSGTGAEYLIYRLC